MSSNYYPGTEKGRVVAIGGFEDGEREEEREEREREEEGGRERGPGPRGRVVISVNEFGDASVFLLATKHRMFSLDLEQGPVIGTPLAGNGDFFPLFDVMSEGFSSATSAVAVVFESDSFFLIGYAD